jgi:signal transduction histidine kinase
VFTLQTLSSLVAITLGIATPLALLLRSTRTSTLRFAMFALSIAAYHGALLTTALVDDVGYAAQARALAGAAVYVTATQFLDAVLGESTARARRRWRFVVAAGAIGAIVGVSPLVRFMPVAVLLATFVIGALGWRVATVLWRAAHVESAAERTRLFTLGIGGVACLVTSSLDLLALAHVPVPSVGGFALAAYLYFIMQALIVRRLLDLHELLGKALVFGATALLLASVYGVLVVWMGEAEGAFLANTVVAASLVLVLFDPLRTVLEETATRVFFREQLSFAVDLRRLVQVLQTTIELRSAIDVTLDALYDSKRVTHASLFLVENDGMGFVLQSHRGPSPVAVLEGKAHPVVFAHLLKAATPLLREALTRRAVDVRAESLTDEGQKKPLAADEAFLRGLDALQADLVVPLRAGTSIVGLLCLKDERLSDAYASDEIAALMELADQLAINVENSRLFGLLRERDRLATLGEMSAGLAHEIRNPLAAIKGAAQVLDPARIGGDDGELMQIIVDEVDRLNTVVSGFLDYARPFRGTFSAVSVNDAARRTAQLMAHDLGADVKLAIDLRDDVPDVNGDAERLQQVLINLILNAADAMQRKGTITISTSVVSDGPDRASLEGRKPARSVELRVRDDGPGIAKATLEQIFIPFFTTKERGTGLGLALCQRIVQHHGGTIEVRSSEGRGTTFVIRLPAIESRRVSSLSSSVPALDPQPTAR